MIKASSEEHDRTTAYMLGMTHFFGRIMNELQLKPEQLITHLDKTIV